MSKEQMIDSLARLIVDQAKGDLTDAVVLAGAMSCDLINRVKAVLRERGL